MEGQIHQKWSVGTAVLAKFFLDISFFPICCAAAVLRRRFFGDSDDAKVPTVTGARGKQRREIR